MRTFAERKVAILLSCVVAFTVGCRGLSAESSTSRMTARQSIVTPGTAVGSSVPDATPVAVPQTAGIEAATLIGGRVWHGPVSPPDVGKPTLTAQQRDESRRFARSLAICSEEEALEFIANKMGTDDWEYAVARRSTKEQILRWLKGLEPTDPSTETSSVLWIVGIYASQPFSEAQYYGWTFPSSEPVEGRSTGFRDAIFVVTEDKSPVIADRARWVQVATPHPNEPYTDEEYIAALRRISDLPEMPSQIEAFPSLEGLCLMPRE